MVSLQNAHLLCFKFLKVTPILFFLMEKNLELMNMQIRYFKIQNIAQQSILFSFKTLHLCFMHIWNMAVILHQIVGLKLRFKMSTKKLQLISG